MRLANLAYSQPFGPLCDHDFNPQVEGLSEAWMEEEYCNHLLKAYGEPPVRCLITIELVVHLVTTCLGLLGTGIVAFVL